MWIKDSIFFSRYPTDCLLYTLCSIKFGRCKTFFLCNKKYFSKWHSTNKIMIWDWLNPDVFRGKNPRPDFFNSVWSSSHLIEKLWGNDRKKATTLSTWKSSENSWQFVLAVPLQNGQDINFNEGLCSLDYGLHNRHRIMWEIFQQNLQV